MWLHFLFSFFLPVSGGYLWNIVFQLLWWWEGAFLRVGGFVYSFCRISQPTRLFSIPVLFFFFSGQRYIFVTFELDHPSSPRRVGFYAVLWTSMAWLPGLWGGGIHFKQTSGRSGVILGWAGAAVGLFWNSSPIPRLTTVFPPWFSLPTFPIPWGGGAGMSVSRWGRSHFSIPNQGAPPHQWLSSLVPCDRLLGVQLLLVCARIALLSWVGGSLASLSPPIHNTTTRVQGCMHA